MAETKIKFPYEIKPLDFQLNKELLKYFLGEKTGYVQVGPKNYFFPFKYKTEAENYYNFQARPSDIWVVTFPRSGTTFTQELVWLLANNLNFDRAKQEFLTERFPFFEFDLLSHDLFIKQLLRENANNKENQEFIEKLSRPVYEKLNKIPLNQQRFIKTHFPFSLLPPSVIENKCKIIYVSRNPKDVAVSYYHLSRLFRTLDYVGDFERFWNYFEQGLHSWAPFHSHVKEALAYRSNPNVFFLQFEELRSDLPNAIQKIATFLQLPPVTAFDVKKVQHHMNIYNFGKNPSVNGSEMDKIGILNKIEESFVRTGQVGGIRQEFLQSQGLNERADKWLKDNEIKL